MLAAASDRSQARLAFEEAAGILKANPRIAAAMRFADYRHRIVHPKSGSVLTAISCDADRQHGTTPTFALIDELHAWKSRALFDVLRTGAVKTADSLITIISTAGAGTENVAYDIFNYARRVARGDVDDEGTLPILFETPGDVDWRDERQWFAVNPGLSCNPPYPDIVGLRQLAKEAEERPADRIAFEQLHLCRWQEVSTAPFVDMHVYDEGKAPFDMAEVETWPCWIGVDLSSNNDLTAVVCVWRSPTGALFVMPWFFIPEEGLRARALRDKVPYPRWRDEGHIEVTPGSVVDFSYVEGAVNDICDQYDVKEILVDPHLARSTLNNLLAAGRPAIEHRQGWISMAPAVAALERAIIGRTLRHAGHPVLRWNCENVVVATDKAGNKTFTKAKSRDRIDGMVALAMAVGRATASEPKTPSIYDRPELWEPVSHAKPSLPAEDDATILRNPAHPQWHAARERFERQFVDDEDF